MRIAPSLPVPLDVMPVYLKSLRSQFLVLITAIVPLSIHNFCTVRSDCGY